MQNKLMLNKGMFITFEGIDGSGKSTQVNKLKHYIKKENIKNFIFTREPGGGSLGKKVRSLLLNNNKNNSLSIESQILLLTAARYEHYEKLILPNIKRNKIIVSDRYQDSTFAYQCGDDVNLQKILKNLNQLLFKKFKPNLTFLLDIKPDIAMRRISKRKKNNSFDKKKLSLYKSVRKNYLYLAKNNKRIKILNAEKKEEEIFRNITNIIFNKIKK